MKSSFLYLLLAASLMTTMAWGQTSASTAETTTSFDKFWDRVKISYFGVLTTPTFEDMEKGDWENASISPEFSNGTNQDSYPTNIWGQLAFGYNFGGPLSFVVLPRFVVHLAHPKDRKGDDTSLVALEDLLVGVQGVVYSSLDKKFNLWVRPGMRVPTSRASRHTTNGGAGSTTHQFELAYSPTYDFNKEWQLGVFGMLRSWIVEAQYTCKNRCRVYTAPYIQYTISDKTKFQLWYEHMWETDRRSLPADDRELHFKDVWQNVMVGVGHDVTDKLNLFPYVSAFVNDVPFSNDSFWLGMWISYKIK